MLFQYQTYTVYEALEKFIENFNSDDTQPALDEVDLLDYEHICRIYESLNLVKPQPYVVILDDYELGLLSKFMENI